jgi:hypothetical protein
MPVDFIPNCLADPGQYDATIELLMDRTTKYIPAIHAVSEYDSEATEKRPVVCEGVANES